MDGVLWLGMTPIMPLGELFTELDKLGINYALATNNASRTVEQYVEKFRKLGAEIEPWRILSSAETTGAYLANQYPNGSRVYVLGADGLRYALSSRGFDIIDLQRTDDLAEGVKILGAAGKADIVVVGFNPQATYGDFAAATYFVNKGARFIGSNPDMTYPTEIGVFPGAGSLINLVQGATGVTPTIIGKPFRYIYDEALKRLNGTPADTAMVGDRLNTDIAGAVNAGIPSIMVLSGISTREELAASDVQPDFVMDDVRALLELLKAVN